MEFDCIDPNHCHSIYLKFLIVKLCISANFGTSGKTLKKTSYFISSFVFDKSTFFCIRRKQFYIGISHFDE